MDNLKRKIQEYINEFDLPTSAFEKKIKVGNSVINRILDDTVKNPSIETILKIADTLNCSLDDLFDRKQFSNKSLFQNNITPYDNELFRSVCLYSLYYIDLNKITHLSLDLVGNTIEEIYKHCQNNNLTTIDTKFANWLLKNNLRQPIHLNKY